MIMGADISSIRLYRYSLTRRWSNMSKKMVFIFLNPSTAGGKGNAS